MPTRYGQTLENGKPVSAYDDTPLRKPMYFACADIDDPVSVTVEIGFLPIDDIRSVTVHPLSRGIAVRREGTRVTFEVDSPGTVTLMVNGDHTNRPLHLFFSPPVEAPPEGAIVFGPGYHDLGYDNPITLIDGQTLYLAPGAWVEGMVHAKNARNIRIMGRGVLSQRRPGAVDYAGGTTAPSGIVLTNCQDVSISGIVLTRGIGGWCSFATNCDRVRISDYHVLASVVWSADGFNPCNCRDVTVERSFIRSGDDCIAIKGNTGPSVLTHPHEPPAEQPSVENIRVRGSVFWSDHNEVVVIGCETRARHIRNIRISDCDVLVHSASEGLGVFGILPLHGTDIRNVVYDDIRVEHCEEQLFCFRFVESIWNIPGDLTFPGTIADVVIRNVSVLHQKDGPRSEFTGYAPDKRIENVLIDGLHYSGKPVADAAGMGLRVNEHVADVRFASVGGMDSGGASPCKCDNSTETGFTVPLWRVTEIALESEADYTNPYADAEVSATFHGPGGETIHRPAFWDGDRTWKLRFAPTAPGTWRWSSTCTNPHDAGVHGRTGELTATAVETNIPLHRHGFLRVSTNGRHFVYADGTPFFWLGDTHWQMPDRERVDACNHPEHAGGICPHGGQFQHLLADRIARGFNVYQTYPNATSAHWWAEPFNRIDPERFRAVFDVQMDQLADAGIVIALGCGHFNNSTRIPKADLCRFARYLVARYGAHPVVWITCQEMNAPVDLGGKESNRPAAWKAVAEQIARDDGYCHPHSAHQWVYDVDVEPLGQEPWHAWFALQGGHRNSGLTPQARYRGYYDYSPTQPVLETEAMYERVDCGGVNTTDEARQSACKALLCGSPGYTYGGAGIWFLKWDAADQGCAQYNHAIGSWHEGMALPGAAQMTVLKQLFLGLDWTQLTPRFSDPAWAEWADHERCVLATVGNRLYLAYCYGDSSEGTLKGLDPQADYAASWVDPRTGTETLIADALSVRKDGSWPVPAKLSGDWLLRVASI